jgi:hypothetical protein
MGAQGIKDTIEYRCEKYAEIHGTEADGRPVWIDNNVKYWRTSWQLIPDLR